MRQATAGVPGALLLLSSQCARCWRFVNGDDVPVCRSPPVSAPLPPSSPFSSPMIPFPPFPLPLDPPSPGSPSRPACSVSRQLPIALLALLAPLSLFPVVLKSRLSPRSWRNLTTGGQERGGSLHRAILRLLEVHRRLREFSLFWSLRIYLVHFYSWFYFSPFFPPAS